MKISPVYTMPFSFHSGLVSCHFQSVFIRKRESGMKHIGLVRSRVRVNRRPLNNTFKHVIRNKCVWNSTDGAQWTVEDTTLTRTSYTLQELANVSFDLFLILP